MMTSEEVQRFLTRQSEESFKHRLPVLLYLSLVSAVGVGGNTIVCLVYWFQFKASATRVFVLAFAACDLVTNVLGLPLQIGTIRHAYDMDDYWLCRGFFFFATISSQASGFLLTLVALNRHRLVCRPFKKQLNARKALFLVLGTVGVAVVMFAPFVPMYGIHTHNTNDPAVSAKICWVEDEYKDTPYLLVYRLVIITCFIISFGIVGLAYLLIGLRTWRQLQGRLPFEPKNSKKSLESGRPAGRVRTLSQRERTRAEQICRQNYPPFAISSDNNQTVGEVDDHLADHEEASSSAFKDEFQNSSSYMHKTDSSEKCEEVTPQNFSSQSDFPERQESAGNDRPFSKVGNSNSEITQEGAEKDKGKSTLTEDVRSDSGEPDHVKLPPAENKVCVARKAKTLRRKRTPTRVRRLRSRTTLMMFVLTVFYIINWLPHLIMRFLRKDPVNWCDNFTDCGTNIYPIVVRSYYINSAINAFVYGFCNPRFRQKCREFFCLRCRKLCS